MSVDWDSICFEGEEDGEYVAELLFDHFASEKNTREKMLLIIRHRLTRNALKKINEYLTYSDNGLPMVIYHNHLLRQEMIDAIRDRLRNDETICRRWINDDDDEEHE